MLRRTFLYRKNIKKVRCDVATHFLYGKNIKKSASQHRNALFYIGRILKKCVATSQRTFLYKKNIKKVHRNIATPQIF